MWALRLCLMASFAAGFTGAPGPARAGDAPGFGPATGEHTAHAIAAYEALAEAGGWPIVPAQARSAKRGDHGPHIVALKQRLAVTDDLASAAATGDLFDEPTEEALKRFQARHGLSQTATVGNLTFRALNVPVTERLQQLRKTQIRLAASTFQFGNRYIVVNIPGASLEAVADGRVERRHIAIVGRKERASPIVEARITAVNLNPTWTVPVSILKADVMPHVVKDPGFLAKQHMRVLNAEGQEIEPGSVDWSGRSGVNFSVRQDPGPTNSLGQLRLDMPNRHAVFLHDTPKKGLFRSDVRFHSSGCARIEDVRDLAAWLLDGSDFNRERIDREIDTGDRMDLKLSHAVPVAWVYLTGWATADGVVQFRPDVYGLDSDEPPAAPRIETKAAPRADTRLAGASKTIGKPQMPVAKSTPVTPAAKAGLPATKLAAARTVAPAVAKAPIDPVEITGSIPPAARQVAQGAGAAARPQ